MRKVLSLWVLVMVLCVVGKLFADTDLFTITCTPTGSRGVLIGTTTVAFGNMLPGASSTTAAIPMTSTGTVANIGYQLSAAVGSASGIAATMSSDETPTADELVLQAQFNDTTPTFAAEDIIDSGTPANVVEGGAYDGDQDLSNMPLSEERDLWCKVSFPSGAINFTQEQTITVTVTATEDSWN